MKTRVFYYIILIILLVSCESNFPCIKGNNIIATETRSIGEFTGVYSYGSFVVDIFMEENFSLKVEADENLLESIDTYIQGSNLILDTKRSRCLRSREPIRVTVGMPYISAVKLGGSGKIFIDKIDVEQVNLELTGSGNMECPDINTDYTDIHLTGSGEIDLRGFSDVADFEITGSGNIRAINMEMNQCFANISGSGNIYAWVNELLDVIITGSGNVNYKGSPEIVSSITGSGKIRKH